MVKTEHFKTYPFQINTIDEKEKALVRKLLNADPSEYVRVGPKKYLETANISQLGLELLNFQARKDDVWLFGYQRSGTTMTQEMLWLIKNDLDFEGAAKEVLDHRFPVIDNSLFLDGKEIKEIGDRSHVNEEVKIIARKYEKPYWQALNEMTGNRFIKAHLPISLSPPSVFEVGCKVVYCARHPKDVLVSLFHILKLFKPKEWEDISFESYWTLFKNNLLWNTPWFEHVKEGWAKRNDKNVLFLYYEDTKKDIRGTLIKIANFLDKKLSDNDLNKLEEHFKIENFRKNKSVNNDHFIELGIASKNKEHQFIRKGEIGGWKKYFTPELNAEVDKWIQENLKDTDLVLPDRKSVV